MQLLETELSFVAAFTQMGWLEKYALTANGTPILAWSGRTATELCRLSPEKELLPLCSLPGHDQSSPVPYNHLVAFFAEDPTHENTSQLYIYDLLTQKHIAAHINATARSRSLVWLDQKRLVTLDCPAENAHLVVVDAENGERLQTLLELPGKEQWVDPNLTVNASGDLLLVWRDEQGRHLVRYTMQTGKTTVLLNGNKSAEPLLASWSPDGTEILCLVRRAKKLDAVVLAPACGTMQTLAVPPLKSLPVWHPDGQKLVLTLDQWPYTKLALYDRGSSQLTPFPLAPEMMAASPQWLGQSCYFVAYSLCSAPGLQCWDTTTDTVKAITPTSDEISPLLPQLLTIPSPQGFTLPCLLLEPACASRGTILMLHGGPAGAWNAGWEPVAATFFRSGYRVVLINPRGSTVKTWPLPSVPPGQYGISEIEDIGVCLAYLRQHLLREGEKCAVYGNSYGAFLAYRAAVRFPEEIQAAILSGGYLYPFDLTYSSDPEVQRFLRYAFPPDEQRTCPPSQVDAACPTLMVHGELDTQVPAFVAIANAMRLQGAGHELLILPEEGHGYRQKKHIALWLNKALEFLAMHIGQEQKL